MGDMADDAYHEMIQREAEIESYMDEIYKWYSYMYINPERFRKIIKWRTKNGKQILLSEMTTEHIQNTIRLLERTKDESSWIDIFKLELEVRNQV